MLIPVSRDAWQMERPARVSGHRGTTKSVGTAVGVGAALGVPSAVLAHQRQKASEGN